MSDPQLSMAYEVCRGVARSQAKNFYYAFLALPKDKRNALCAVYAFMRHADDLSDDPGLPFTERDTQLQAWMESLGFAVEGRRTDDPVILALADTQSRFNIPLHLFEQLIHGTRMDLQFASQSHHTEDCPIAPYATFQDLYRYCYHVASVVGLVCLHIFGYKDAEAERLAEETGIAFQLTNIIRDVKEDASMGRVYIPEEDLARFQRSPIELSAANLLNGFQPASFAPLLEFEAQRARHFYESANKLIPLINEDSRPCLWALVEIYRRLLEKIASQNYNVFQGKVRLTVPEKLRVLSQGLLKAIL